MILHFLIKYLNILYYSSEGIFLFSCFYWCIVVSHHIEYQFGVNIHAHSSWCPSPPPPPRLPPTCSTENDVGIISYIHLVYDSNSMDSLLSYPYPSLVPLPLHHWGFSIVVGVPYVSSLLPKLHILMKTYDPSFFVIG